MSVERPWIVFGAGVLALLVVGLAVRRAVAPGDHRADEIASRVAARADARGGAQAGWAAREHGSGSAGGAARPAAGQGTRPGGTGSRTIPDSGSRGSGPVIAGSGTGDGHDNPATTGTLRAPTGVAVDVAAADAAPFRGARTANDAWRGGVETTQVASEPTESQQVDGPAPEDLIVAIPLKDGSLEAAKGDSPVVAEDIAYDGGNFRFGPDSQMVLPNAGNINSEAGTIAFWVQPDWAGAEETDAAMVDVRSRHVFENRIQIGKNGRYLRFIFADDTGYESGAGIDISHWQPGEWHNVVATYGNGMTYFYVDGKLVGQEPYSGQFNVLPTTQFRVGSNYPGDSPGATGAMSDFRLYRRPLTPEEVSDLAARQP